MLDLGVDVQAEFAQAKECQQILARVVNEVVWVPAHVGWYGSGNGPVEAPNPERTTARVSSGYQEPFPVVRRMHQRIERAAQDQWQIELTCHSRYGLSRYDPRSKVAGHRDTVSGDQSRLVTNILYLNEEFEGGELVFPLLGMVIRPTCGMMISFFSEHVHAVREVLSGVRYCLIFFSGRSEGVND